MAVGQIKIALIGKKATGKTFVAFYLQKHHKFKRIRMDDGVTKFIRDMYGYSNYKRPKWEFRYDIYNALYRLDPDMHVNYLFRKMLRIDKDIVVEDVRYVSELKLLKEAGFIIIRIASPETRRKLHLSKALRDAPAGTLILAEAFYDDKTAQYSADYTIINEDREKTRQDVIKLLDTIREQND